MPPKSKKPSMRAIRKALRQALAARGIEVLPDNGLDAVGDMFSSQTCAHCGGRGSGLGIQHSDACLVPLAVAAQKVGS